MSRPTRRGWRTISVVWLIPLVALAIGGYLAWSTLADKGLEITVTFDSPGELKAGTKVEHKAVELGTVTRVELSSDLNHVDVRVQMQRDASPFLTDKARFWVARLQFAGGSVSGINSLISGPYIEMDPGAGGGERQVAFKGLAEPPGVRSDEPGTTFIVTAPTITDLRSGTGVFYRDILVGEVLESQVVEGDKAIRASVFVRRPFDERVRTGTVFWQTKGVSTEVTGYGMRVQVASLQAALSGGVSFGLPPDAAPYAVAPAGTQFPLFDDEATADRASYRLRTPYVMYFETAVGGLAAGSAVLLQGTQVGAVTGVTVIDNAATGQPRVRVTLDFLAQAAHMTAAPTGDPAVVGRQLVAAGMQGKLETASYVTNSQAIALEFAPLTPQPVLVSQEAGILVLPTVPTTGSGGFSGLAARLNGLARLPFAALGNAANAMLVQAAASARSNASGRPLAALIGMLTRGQATIRDTDASVTQALRGLPATADKLQQALAEANQAVGAADETYGSGSGGAANAGRVLEQYYETARRTRLLADRLSQHPEAIIRGTTGQSGER